MKKNILILSNSNFFTVFSRLFLYKFFHLENLNLRYANEEMDDNEHYINQVKEMQQDFHYKRGFLRSRYFFSYNERLVYRISKNIEKKKPHMIFFEMKTFENGEWAVLQYLNAHYSIPIVTFIPATEKSKETMFRLAECGVREVITQYEEELFISAIKRNMINPSL